MDTDFSPCPLEMGFGKVMFSFKIKAGTVYAQLSVTYSYKGFFKEKPR